MIIRQLMTEVLLEVTTEEICLSAAEAYQQEMGKLNQTLVNLRNLMLILTGHCPN